MVEPTVKAFVGGLCTGVLLSFIAYCKATQGKDARIDPRELRKLRADQKHLLNNYGRHDT